MIGQETATPIPYSRAERPPTRKELDLWAKAETLARRVNLLSYLVKTQWQNIKLTVDFAKINGVPLEEDEIADTAERMFQALREIEELKDYMCAVNQLELGVSISASGNDLDIVQPPESSLGWVLPAVIGAVIVVGIIARWAHLEKEVVEITRDYNGILKRSDMALCENPDSEVCANWQKTKVVGGYHKRETIIESIKSAASSVGSAAKKGLGWGVALAIPLLLLMYAPRKKV